MFTKINKSKQLSLLLLILLILFKLKPSFNICVVAGQNVTLFFDFSVHWLLTFTFCKHCALPKIQEPSD